MPTQKTTARLSKKPRLFPEGFNWVDAYWHESKYLTAC